MCSTHNAAPESLMKNHSNIPTGTESALCSGLLNGSATLLSIMVFLVFLICCDITTIFFNYHHRDLCILYLYPFFQNILDYHRWQRDCIIIIIISFWRCSCRNCFPVLTCWWAHNQSVCLQPAEMIGSYPMWPLQALHPHLSLTVIYATYTCMCFAML